MHSRVIPIALALFLAIPAQAQQKQRSGDWLEPINRTIFAFNSTVDRHVLRPVARGYVRLVPDWGRKPVRNFFNNLQEPITVANSLLQGKGGDALQHSARFAINSTLGLGGLADLAQHWHLPHLHREDLGQTLAVWGVPRGPYIVLPLLGPSTLRDSLGLVGDGDIDPLRHLQPVHHRSTLYSLRLVDVRSRILSTEQVFGSDYDSLRDLYLQRREYLIRDGAIQQDDFGSDW